MKHLLMTIAAAMLMGTGCGGSSSQSSNKEEESLVPLKPPAMSLIDASAIGDLDAVKKTYRSGDRCESIRPR